jgi:hypothetical protein
MHKVPTPSVSKWVHISHFEESNTLKIDQICIKILMVMILNKHH